MVKIEYGLKWYTRSGQIQGHPHIQSVGHGPLARGLKVEGATLQLRWWLGLWTWRTVARTVVWVLADHMSARFCARCPEAHSNHMNAGICWLRVGPTDRMWR